jgi:tetratricopeptide (TPR) repeat protein
MISSRLYNILSSLIVFLFVPVFIIASNTEDKAAKHFKLKQYNEALPLFEELLNQNPDNPFNCYYLAVCKTETNHFGEQVKNLFRCALNGKVPDDIYYFTAKNLHALNEFENAARYYSQYKNIVGRKIPANYKLDELIAYNNQKVNPFIKASEEIRIVNEPEVQPAHMNWNFTTGTNPDSNDSITTTELIPNNHDELAEETTLPFADSLIHFVILSDVNYSNIMQFRTNEGKKAFLEGLETSDSLQKILNSTQLLRVDYGNTENPDEQRSISEKVLSLEGLQIELKRLADKKYMEANEMELSYWKNATFQEKRQLQIQNDSIRNEYEIRRTPQAPLIDSTLIADYEETVDSVNFSEQIITFEEPKQVKNNIVFKIQIGSFNTQLPPATKKLFDKIGGLRKIDKNVDEKNFTVYTIGELSNFKDAQRLQTQIRQEGIKDAFVIALKDGKRIPTNEALEILKNEQ